MKQLQYFINMFTKITTGTLLICAVILTLNGIEMWTTRVLWHIILVGLVTSLITMLALPDKEYSKREGVIRYILHYVLITAAVLFFGNLFGWYNFTLPGCLIMCAAIAAVYGFTWLTTWLSRKRSADELNRALEKRREKK